MHSPPSLIALEAARVNKVEIFDKNGIEAKSLADEQGSIAEPRLGGFRER
jgi:hypothetical protein